MALLRLALNNAHVCKLNFAGHAHIYISNAHCQMHIQDKNIIHSGSNSHKPKNPEANVCGGELQCAFHLS